MKLAEIRSKFLSYFEQNGHTIVKSSTCVPQDDPTILFTNAGMNQFKDVFTGKEKRDYVRATSIQKCVRAGGKHNDLDNVGYTNRHHTFFEMLGNFSFGDYFKKEAIHFTWDFLVNELGMDKEKLLVTVYHTDDEAYDIWKELTGWGDDKIIRIPTKDNFWEMGPTGPCGPSTEIFYDYGEDIAGGKPGTPEEDGDRYVEIWNNVFMQYYRHEDGSLTDLPAQSVDTGQGLERLASILQGKTSNYDTDLFLDIKQSIVDKLGVSITKSNYNSFNVIADHLRCMTFLIADGVLPSNEGRGYVLRRIMRRAMRHCHILGTRTPVLYQLTSAIERLMGDAYPELSQAAATISSSVKKEEDTFLKTLSTGLKILEDASSDMKSGDVLSGEVAFKLYDTYGFPVDMTADAMRAKNISVDMDEFEVCMAEQKARSKAGSKMVGDTTTEKVWYDIHQKTGDIKFVRECSSVGIYSDILAIIDDGASVPNIQSGKAWIVTHSTPFYGESGGQIGDTGTLSGHTVIDTKIPVKGLIAHLVEVTSELKVGDKVGLVVDCERRQQIKIHHTAAHLLQAALKRVLGDHVAQRGSYVDPSITRFDFTHPSKMTEEEIRHVEVLINQWIDEKLPVTVTEMSMDEAIQAGATALFGEKYDDIVRVVRVDDSVSLEFCGGTHVDNTSELKNFYIEKEESIAAGVRRINAQVGDKESNESATDWLQARFTEIDATKKAEAERIAAEKEAAKSTAASEQATAIKIAYKCYESLQIINGVDFVTIYNKAIDTKNLKPIAQNLLNYVKDQKNPIVLVIVNEFEGKVSVLIAMSDQLTNDKFNAPALIREVSPILGGKGGGGQPTMAQAGGSDISKAEDAFEFVKKQIETL